VFVTLYPMLEHMIVPAKEDFNVMFAEERRVAAANHLCLFLGSCSAVWPGREGRMMRVNNDVGVSLAIQPFELAFGPSQLLLITPDVGIKRNHKRVAIAERKDRIAAQTARRAFLRNQLRICGIEVFQPR